MEQMFTNDTVLSITQLHEQQYKEHLGWVVPETFNVLTRLMVQASLF
jgi:hypothetical protein